MPRNIPPAPPAPGPGPLGLQARPGCGLLRAWALVAAGVVAAGGTVAVQTAAAGPAVAGTEDEAAFKELETRYKKLARNRDDAANRERRQVLLQMFDFRGLKACRKLLREAYDDELLPDQRIVAVQVLAACGEPKEIDQLLAVLKKERVPGPQIALGQGLSFTAPSAAPVVAQHAAEAVRKQKGELARALLEGVGELGDSSALPALTALAGKLPREEEFERVIALGSCGRGQGVPLLESAAASGDSAIRLAAAIGLGRTGGVKEPPAAEALPLLVRLVGDADFRVVEAAAAALGAAKHADAKEPLVAALATAPRRTREAIRTALREITGRDAGYDAAAWSKAGGSAPAPTPSTFAGLEFQSDQVALVADLSRSMDWNERLSAARKVLGDAVRTLPPEVTLGAIGGARVPVPMAPKLSAGNDAKLAADAWLAGLLTAGGFDLLESLQYVVDNWPAVDTILLATDSPPWGDGADATPLEVIQEFRRANRMRRVRVMVAFVAPGGRYEMSEIDTGEWIDRKELLQQFAESTGGLFATFE